MNKTPRVYCYGEVLWDCFPDREILGGAPFNVAFRLNELGADVQVISAVGDDSRGQHALRGMSEFGLTTGLVTLHKDLETGYVQVHLDQSGAATYTITEPVAWDRIPASINDLQQSSILIFGSLALRQEFNKEQLQKLLGHCDFCVFDINLRPPHYEMDYLVSLLPQCDCLKLNEEELPMLLDRLNITTTGLEQQLIKLSEASGVSTICVTLGADGAALWHNEKLYNQPGFPAQVADTVGAGDSFLAGLVYKLFIENTRAEVALEFGCALGSLVASKAGATATVTLEEINDLLQL